MAKVDASRAVYLAQAEVLVQLVRSWELDAPQHRKWGRVFVAVVSDAPREEIRLSHECGAVGHLPANCSDREHNFMLTVNESTSALEETWILASGSSRYPVVVGRGSLLRGHVGATDQSGAG